jgi:microsomal dipeptidase-like Zn-dependent dipeptidase
VAGQAASPAPPIFDGRPAIWHLVDRRGLDGALILHAVGDATGLLRLIAALGARGYDEPALRKLASENWLRVLRATWRAEDRPALAPALPSSAAR